MTPRFFQNQGELHRWFERHHRSTDELWVGYFKRPSGRPSITWPESVDQALCFGWIDGVRKSLGPDRYAIRFTPRKAKSIWSAVRGDRERIKGDLKQAPEWLK